jgi:TonB family protein
MVHAVMFLVAQATPSPTPLASKWPCAVPTHEAKILKRASPHVSSATVAQAEAAGAKPVADVRILVGPDGSVQEASIYTTSGSAALDSAAIATAKASTFTPKVIYCKPVSGVYQFPVDFTTEP